MYLYLLAIIGFSSCKKPVPPVVILPTNLITAINVNGSEIKVQATAENANFYTITFVRGNDSTVIESTNGNANYTCSTSGKYIVKTTANTTYSDFISKTDTVNVTINSSSSGAPTTGYTSPLTYSNYTLVWDDEFNGNSLSSSWTFDIGTGSSGWGNNELQYYTDKNHSVNNGYLEITAKKEQFNAQQYTSSRLKTQGIKSWKYGRIDIRAALPYGQGIWPAFWMLGDNISSIGWPSCGEIDIMELIGGAGLNDKTVHGTVHWSENGSHAQFGKSKTLASGKFADEFHVFSIVWNQNSITWLLDNVAYNTVDITPTKMNAFKENFFLIFNMAVGGNWPGNPDATTIFPQKMYIDYVRIFQ